MALHPCQAVAPFAIGVARDSVAFMFAPFTGTIKRVDLAVPTVNAAGDSVFNLRVNGASQWPTEGDRPRILASALKGNKSALAIAVVEGDILQFDATGVPTGGITGPVMMQLLIDDDLGSVPEGPAGGDLIGEYPDPVVNQLKGRSLGGLPEVTAFKSDNFNDNSLNTSLWTLLGSSSLPTEQNSRLEISYGSSGGGVRGVEWAAGADMTNHWAGFKLGDLSLTTIPFNMQFAIGVRVDTGTSARIYLQVGTTSLELRALCWDGSNGVLVNVLIGTYDPAVHVYMRVRNIGASQWVFETSVDGVTWTVRHTTGVLDATKYGATRLWKSYCDATSGAADVVGWIDDANSSVPMADSIIGSDLYPLMWDQANNRFSLLKALSLIKTTVGVPVGAPANVPTGYTEARYDQAAATLYIWNGAAWDSQIF